MTAAQGQALEGIVVIEFGQRIAVGAVGSLLAQLGATVVFVEHGERKDAAFEDKLGHRDTFAVGKQSVRWKGADDSELKALVATADVIVVSTDADAARLPWPVPEQAILCNITAFGTEAVSTDSAPVSDHLIQAMSGITDTTGEDAGAPVTVGAPVVEFSTALYAASAIVAGLRFRRLTGKAQAIDMALYDCAVNAMATFLPSHFGGGKPRRLGNRHSMAAPWNAYRANDGWVLLCSASDAHWQKICDVVGRHPLASDPAYAALRDRMARRDEVDAVVSGWIAERSVEQCVEQMAAAGLACGPIVKVDDLPKERNLLHRSMVRTISAPGGRPIRVAGNLFENARATNLATASPAVDSGRAGAGAITRRTTKSDLPQHGTLRLPLQGVRVVELGQYTTAPLVGRHLASLGAEVLKVEPLEGDAARQWAPHRDGLSYFFVMSNAGKRAIGIDLRKPDGRDFFRRLLQSADIVVENMKPGSLARLGFSQGVLTEINPRLVYAAITGFGANSAYLERPAFDTVVQAMSGLMDVTRSGSTPLKAGISVADICGGQLGLLATLAGLEQRDRTGQAPSYDLSMQDVAAWLTQLSWNGKAPERGAIQADANGFVSVDRSGAKVAVKSVAEVVDNPRTTSRGLMASSTGPNPWPLLGSPLRLTLTPPHIDRAIGKPQPVSPELERELGLAAAREASKDRS